MYIVLYEMQTKPGRETEFEQAWAVVTDAIKEHCGGLGSRLHRTETPGLYVAYAQWPSREKFLKRDTVRRFSEFEETASNVMRETTEYIRTIHQMDIVDDRL